MTHRPKILITNDDGIDSHFLRALVEAHRAAGFDIALAAPLEEQSWISRALSRRREVAVHARDEWGFPAWAIDGTPTDCVNIALGHLVEGLPAAVVSGINLGYNANLPHVLGSGTVAGALEGAFWGVPAVAYSLQLPHENYEEIRQSKGVVTGVAAESLAHAARRAAALTRDIIAREAGQPMEAPRVHNYNFPRVTLPETPVEATRVGYLRPATMFQRQSSGGYRFKFPFAPAMGEAQDTDEACLNRGHISHTVLDFAHLGGL